MEKRRSALEAYRASQRAASTGSIPAVTAQQIATSTPTPPPANRRLTPDDPVAYAAKKCENWLQVGNVVQLVEYYKFIESPSMRRKIVSWAIEKAKMGDLQALLGIGVDDPEPSVRKHAYDLLRTLQVDDLLPKIKEGEFTIKERRSIPALLARSKSPEAGRLLASMADHADSGVRANAVKALARFPLQTNLQIPAFRTHLMKDASPDVRLCAAEGLARIGTPEAIAILESAANAESSTREIQAVYAGTQAKKHQREMESEAEIRAIKEKKPFPTAAVAKALLAIAIIGGALWRLLPLFIK